MHYPLACGVEKAEIVLRMGISLFGRLAVPGRGFLEVLRHSSASVVQHAEVGLRIGLTLLGRLAVPGRGFLEVLRHP